MSRRNLHQSNSSITPLGRRQLAKRAAALTRAYACIESLEKRRLLSGYTFTLANQGSGTANGTYLQGLLNGTTLITGDGVTNHTVMLDDTLILPAGYDYDMGTSELKLPNLGAAATVTINGSGQVNTTGWTMTYEGGVGVGGYTAAPTVVLFGGGGSGATATAIYNSSTGLVTGLTITNPGTNYTSAPQVAFEGGDGALTIESSLIGSLPAGRFTPTTATVADLARISGSGPDGIVWTDDPTVEDAQGHLGAPQNYTFAGIEICPDSDTDYFSSAFVQIGIGVSDQSYVPQVANNFTFDQDYIHGGTPGETSDDLTTNGLNTDNSGGFELNANYVTVENSQISDIHAVGVETHGIGGWNLLGNFIINNNYIDGGSEDIIFGGGENFLPDPAQANNISITNNYVTKDPAWNPALPQYAGVSMDVKNDIELKTGTNVTISHNLIENVWVGADQRAEALNIDNIDSHANGVNTWTDVEDDTITDNVFRNVGTVLVLSSGAGDTSYQGIGEDGGSTELTSNVTFSNNLAYDIGGFQWAYDGGNGDDAISLIGQAGGPMQNVTIENNTIIGTDGIMYLEGPSGLTYPVVANATIENNVLDESAYGIVSSASTTDIGTLNSVELSALTITNAGSGYTAAPTVTISGGGATGTNVATATAYIWPTTGFGGYALPLAGQIMYIQLNLDPGTGPGTKYPAAYGGNGYTAEPTITISGGGGTGGQASAIVESDGQIHGYNLTNNVIIGGSQSNYPPTNATTINYFPANENAVQMLDPAGDEYGLSPTSSYYTDGTSGSTPGVSMTALLAADNGAVIPWEPADDPTPATPILQNYYKFNEGSGTTAHDSSTYVNNGGTQHNATINGTYTWNTTGPAGGGITFSGGYASVASFTADSSFTFAAWVNPTSISGNQYIASTANSAFSLYLNSGVLTATGSTGTVTGSTLTHGQWYLVSATFSGGTLTLYVDGNEVGSGSATTVTTPTSTTLYIGDSQGSGSSFNGTLDEVRYYSTSLYQTMSVIGDTNLGRAGGGGYNTSTNGTAITFTGGGGSGAAATAYAENTDGVITSIIMTPGSNGAGYTVAPTMSFGSTGTGAADIPVMSVTPLSYLYAQYGPQFAETTAGGESNVVKGSTTTLSTNVVTPDETYSAATYSWTVLTWPSAAGVGKPSVTNLTGKDIGQASVDFSGVGHYLFQCVVTNSFGQSATVDYPVNVMPVAATNVVFVSPASASMAESHGTNVSTKAFNVNGTSIASLGNTITDQFGNAMPSSGWTWYVPTPASANGSVTSGGVYSAPDVTNNANLYLKYTTGDGLTYTESSASITITDANIPNVPATITVTPGTSNSNVITWTAPNGGGETGYDVYQAADDLGNDGNQIYSSTNLSTLSFTDNAANDPTYAPEPGVAYYYYVEAFNANGNGPASSELGIVTGAPVAPTNLVATGGFTNSIGLTWTNTATNATSVIVLRSTDTNISDAVPVTNNLSGTATSFIDNAANDPTYGAPADGTTYYYWVETSNTYTSLPAASLGATPIGPPTGLTATAIANNQISVSWVDPSTVPGYYLQYQTANGGSWTTSTIAAGDSSYLLTSGLSADTQYNFEIEAYDAAGNSGYSSAVSARTWKTAATPTVYEGFNYSTGGSTNLVGQSGGIGWGDAWDSGVGGDAVYEVYPGSPSVTPTSTYLGSTNAAAFLLETGNSFYSSDNGGGTRTLAQAIPNTSGTTLWASVVVEDLSSTPNGDLQLIGNNTSGGTNNVAFGLNNGAFSVQVLGVNGWGTTLPVEGNTYLLVLEIQYGNSGTNSTLTMYIDPDPTLPSSSWTYYVKPTVANLNNVASVYLSGSNYGLSNANIWDELRIGSSATSVVPTTLPSAPTGLTPTPGANSIVLSWNSASSSTSFVQGYDIWRSTNDGVSYGSAPYATVGSSTLGYTDTGVTSGSTYYYEVTAENATGDSLDSTAVSALISPAVPTIISVTPSTNSLSVTVNWSEASTGSIDYNVQRSTSGTGNWTTVATALTNTSWTDNATNDPSYAPVGNTPYYYEVDAYYAPSGAASAWSANSAQALTIPTAPTLLKATPGTSTITLTWTDPSPTTNITEYNIYRSTNDSFNLNTSYATVSGANAVSYTDTAVGSGTNGGTSYYYEVTAYDPTGNSSPATISGGLASGVATVDAYEGFQYPTGSGWTGANTTGIGFTGNWNVSNSNNASIVSGLTYSTTNGGGVTLTTIGNALKFSGNDTATQTLNQSVGTSGSTLWVSFEINGSGYNSSLQLGSGSSTGEVGFGWTTSTGISEFITTNTDNTFSPAVYTSASTNTTYFLVAEIQYLTASPVVTLYVDPTPNSANGTAPSGALATISKTVPSGDGILGTTNFLKLVATSAASVTFDEIRLGATYNAVAPDPKVAGTNASGKKSPRGHRHSPFLADVATPNNSKVIRSTKPPAAKQNPFYSALDRIPWQWADAANDVDGVLLGTASKNGLFN